MIIYYFGIWNKIENRKNKTKNKKIFKSLSFIHHKSVTIDFIKKIKLESISITTSFLQFLFSFIRMTIIEFFFFKTSFNKIADMGIIQSNAIHLSRSTIGKENPWVTNVFVFLSPQLRSIRFRLSVWAFVWWFRFLNFKEKKNKLKNFFTVLCVLHHKIYCVHHLKRCRFLFAHVIISSLTNLTFFLQNSFLSKTNSF